MLNAGTESQLQGAWQPGDDGSHEEPINHALARHGIDAEDWPYRETITFLHQWVDRFNAEFCGGRLPRAAVSLSRDRRSRLGWYLPSRDGLSLNYRVNLNTRHLTRKTDEVLETLLHELLHLEEHLFGKPGKGNYHTRGFQKRCEDLGIPCDHRGCNLGIRRPSPFTELLEHHGIPITVPMSEELRSALRHQEQPVTKLKRWTCGCTNVWAAVEVQAICTQCGKEFIRV